MYVVTNYQYQQLRNYCKESFIDEIGRQPLKDNSQINEITVQNIARLSMRRFDDVNIEELSDHDMAWTARIIVREYRSSLAQIDKKFNLDNKKD